MSLLSLIVEFRPGCFAEGSYRKSALVVSCIEQHRQASEIAWSAASMTSTRRGQIYRRCRRWLWSSTLMASKFQGNCHVIICVSETWWQRAFDYDCFVALHTRLPLRRGIAYNWCLQLTSSGRFISIACDSKAKVKINLGHREQWLRVVQAVKRKVLCWMYHIYN